MLVPGDLRASLNEGAPAELLIGRLDRAERLGQVTGVGTLLTGALLWWNVGSVDTGVMVGAGLVVIAILIGATVARPASNGLKEALRRGDASKARSSSQRIVGVLAVESALWVGALAAMVS